MWARDSAAVIYDEPIAGSESSNWRSYDLKNANTELLTSEPLQCFSVQPSPYSLSGQLLYSCGNVQTDESTLLIADSDNTNRRVLVRGTFAELQSPMFSPEGQQFIYKHQSPPGIGGVPTFEIRLFDLVTNSERSLVRGCSFARGWLDATAIIVQEHENCGGEAGKLDLYRLDVRSGAKTLLASEVEPH